MLSILANMYIYMYKTMQPYKKNKCMQMYIILCGSLL